MPNDQGKNDKTVLEVLVMVAIIIVIALVGYAVVNAINANRKSNTADTAKTDTNSKSNPVKIAASDLELSGDKFAEKYTGKYVEFDGLVQGTATTNGAKAPHTGLLYGDNFNKGTFADTSMFTITASSQTFGAGLEQFAENNDTPYKSGDYPKVHVVAKVIKFDENYSWVELDPIINVDGSTPSVTLR